MGIDKQPVTTKPRSRGRRRLAALLGAAAALGLSGCGVEYFINTPSGQKMITPRQYKDLVKGGAPHYGVHNDFGVVNEYHIGIAPEPRVRTKPTGIKVTFAIFTLAHVDRALSPFTNGVGTRAGITSSVDARGEDFHFHGTVVVQFARGAGTACMKLAGGQTQHLTQYVRTGFSFVGGTGRAARLRAQGLLQAVERGPYSGHWQLILSVRAKAALFGAPRGLPAHCGQTPAIPTSKVNATFLGFVSSRSAASSTATLVPSGGTISGSECAAGGDLYGVFRYSGPSTARYSTYAYGPGTPQSHTVKVRAGRDPVLLFTKPANGSYQAKIGIESTNGKVLSGTLGFAPLVNVSC